MERPPNHRQAQTIRQIADCGEDCDQRKLPLHPRTVNALISKGYIKDDEYAVGPRGGIYRRYVLTSSAREWLRKYPEPDSMFIMGGFGDIGGQTVISKGAQGSVIHTVSGYREYRYKALWDIHVGAWSINMIGTVDEFTPDEQQTIQKHITERLRYTKDAPVQSWDWSRVTITLTPRRSYRQRTEHYLSEQRDEDLA